MIRHSRNILFVVTFLIVMACKPTMGVAFTALPYPVETKAVKVGNAEIAYADLGQGERTLVLIHGLGSYLPVWKHNLAALSQNHRVIAIDLPGYGKSAKLNHPYSMEFFAQAVRGVVRELDLKRVTLVGHSMGGQIAMTYALMYPGDVEALVLASPAGLETFDDGEAKWLANAVTPAFTCIYLPSLPLQAFVRRAPRWIGAPVAVLSGRRPTVTACSRAAWALGVRPGMTALVAQELAPGLVTAPDDGSPERDALRALGDALLAVSPRVDLGETSGAHHAMYAEVPPRTRGATFGARLRAVVEAQGLRARIGIADDRFTAWVAAINGSRTEDSDEVITVPRGGSAAFLAPLPLSLLAIPAEVQHVLGALGVRTLGEFAALPPPSPMVTTTWDRDYQALARGDGATRLVPHVPAGHLIERVELGPITRSPDGSRIVGIGAALERAAVRIAGRLAGRGQAAAKVLVRAGTIQRDANLAAPVWDARDLADVVGRTLHEAGDADFVEIDVPVTVARGESITRSPDGSRIAPITDAIPAPVLAEASAPLSVASEPPIFRLLPDDHPLAGRLANHRRTQRGKHRTRAAVAAQSRLFRG